MKLKTIETSDKIYDFAAEKVRRSSRWKNKFAEQLYSVVDDIRTGAFDPEALFIVFKAQHPTDPTLIQYPMASIDMDGKMILAIADFLRKEVRK